MSTSSNVSQSTYSPSEPDTPQGSTQSRIQNFDQSLNHAELGLSIEQSLKSAQNEMHQKRIQALRKELDYLKATEWEFEYDKGFVQDSDNDDESEEFLASQLLELEFAEGNDVANHDAEEPDIPEDKSCFCRTGVISYLDTNSNYVLIDGTHYFDTSSCSLNLNLNDKVMYLGFYRSNGSISIVRILENQGSYWGEDTFEETNFKQIEHTLIGQVDRREGRLVHMTRHDLKFSLDEVDGTFVPIEGDLLEMTCTVKADEEAPIGISSAEVLEVNSFRPLGTKVSPAVVTRWDGEYGTCDRKIYIDKQCLQSGVEPKVGTKVLVQSIESCQGECTRRAVQLAFSNESSKIDTVETDDQESTLPLEEDEKLDITYPLIFDNVEFNKKSEIILKIINKSDKVHILNKWIIPSKKRDSQINVAPILYKPHQLKSGASIAFTITCCPKFLGKAKELLIFLFRGLKVQRVVQINVVDNHCNSYKNDIKLTKQSASENIANMRNIRNSNTAIVQGQKQVRPANFVHLRLGLFEIPEKIWSVALGDSGQLIHTDDYSKSLERIMDKLPFLNQVLNIYNYSDRWHALLYMEEVQLTINMRAFDIAKTYLHRYQEYLSIEINGLSERRPSLIMGDRVIVKDVWDDKSPKYEGFIHEIRGNCILMKFSFAFHESYSGSDVSIEFYFSRSTFRRSHQAINFAISNLGPEVLFPSRISMRPPQVPPEKLNTIQWFNKILNSCQKAAVSNILLGECRPKPYIIYGPPGTGKTVTVIETILQILANIPHSRILVATPSNSAANLIAQRMLHYKKKIQHSFVRILAHYLVDSDTIPPEIKPHCVTLDIAREGTAPSKHQVQNGVNTNCQTSFIGRHRVTIGTCYTLGNLAQMGFPKGHFTHVIVDEAGQTTEPEIMIPLTLTDKENGQIIIAGDPKQLGPIITSRYCVEFGMDETYLTRILETFPYQKDYAAFPNGFNEKLVTRLNDNYRSLKEVLTLSSEMFYDGILVENIERGQAWIKRLIGVVAEVFETGDSETGGIYVYGIRGNNTRAEDSPSWYNPQEATMIALTTCKLYKRNVSQHDIGIITPYIAQIKYLRSLFTGMGLPLPKIGTVEEFQGQEKPLILISTVRSTETLLIEDAKNALGFVKCPKRLNVAITRAQVAVLLFCNPHLLCTDPLWLKVIIQAVKKDKYMGCDLPSVLND